MPCSYGVNGNKKYNCIILHFCETVSAIILTRNKLFVNETGEEVCFEQLSDSKRKIVNII